MAGKKNELERVRREAAACRACDLWRDTEGTVFGEGAADARIMLVGEQPGDREDREGHPFVGPAGRMLDRALAEAGLDRDSVWITNAVKHFKHYWRGKRRMHAKPKVTEVEACHPWLEEEAAILEPTLIVALGATAARAVFGPKVRVMRDRGKVMDSPLGARGTVTVHPSYVLRQRDDEARDAAFGRLVQDLRAAAQGVETR